ncbi:hypothetical protein OG864_01435 [Streptomyces sp. NBC_00124]|uniref:hypothetical protein n=1 Tax=Streptomyces sp. NBC_00124 TaxID=2975662 RepID=UPI00224F96CC|nr:hypothetical protein [Streptomyces sp. NBC_00124]MCX5357425.1 hypothetical protein [Streptomyces sp. NBC_00124]
MTDLLAHGRFTPPVGLRLRTLAASLAQSLAWHRFDLCQHGHASQYWGAALHNVHAAGDHDLGAGLLGDLAYQAAWPGNPTTAAHILNHALTRADNPAARCLLQLRLARTLAVQQERRGALRALAAAEQRLAAISSDRPAWCAWISEAVMRSVNLFQPGSVSSATTAWPRDGALSQAAAREFSGPGGDDGFGAYDFVEGADGAESNE